MGKVSRMRRRLEVRLVFAISGNSLSEQCNIQEECNYWQKLKAFTEKKNNFSRLQPFEKNHKMHLNARTLLRVFLSVELLLLVIEQDLIVEN